MNKYYIFNVGIFQYGISLDRKDGRNEAIWRERADEGWTEAIWRAGAKRNHAPRELSTEGAT